MAKEKKRTFIGSLWEKVW